MWHVTLLEYFANELRHTSSHKNDLDLRRGLLEYLTELTLANQLTISIFRLKKQVTHVLFTHELHTCVCLVEAVA